MTDDDRNALVSENRRLRESRRVWRALAIAALLLVFLVMFPFITSSQEVVKFFKNRDTAEEREKLERWVEQADRQLKKETERMKRSMEPDD